MDYRDELASWTYLIGEDDALENITSGMVKQDNIECCVCLTSHWGVKLPNCNHCICPKCYYKIYNGYISGDFHSKNPEPRRPEKPIYPYQNPDINRKLFDNITNDDTYLEWFINENEDLYNSIKMNSDFVDDIDVTLKMWFKNNELIPIYENDLIKYENDLSKYHIDAEEYIYLYEEEKEGNTQKKCPLCRL